MVPRKRSPTWPLVVALLAGCYGDIPTTDWDATEDDALADLPLNPESAAAPHPVLRRLTASQYRHTLSDWFGDALVLPSTLEPDGRSEGLYAVGASLNGLSTLGVERYFNGARAMASQLTGLAPLRDTLVDCDQDGTDACLERVIETWTLRLWRRPSTEPERERLLTVAQGAHDTLGDFDQGLRYAMTAILASPHFLYVHGEGEEGDSDDPRPYTDWEMASRLALLLWNSGPDDALLAAAAAGELTGTDRLRDTVRDMLSDARARRGVRAFAEDWLELDGLLHLTKDPEAFAYFSPDIGAQAREETLALFEHLVIDEDTDLRTLLTTRTTFVNRRLAALYGVPAAAVDGFAQVSLPEDGARAGLLGHASVLALHASPNRSSPTLRGLFVRERLLCQDMPSPPANVDTTIPESSIDAPTMRERLAVHLETPGCSSCHEMTDLIGLGLERFDGLGGFRALENAVPIDPSGDLDGVPFADARGLGAALADHPAFARCLVETVWAYANGRVRALDERDLIDAMLARFEASDHRLLALLEDVAISDGFRRVGEAQP